MHRGGRGADPAARHEPGDQRGGGDPRRPAGQRAGDHAPQHVDEQLPRADRSAPGEIAPGEYVTLEVRDTGVGMDQETLQRIFDPFFTTKFTGRGLGLAAALGIVRGHKGAMKVYAHSGAGEHVQDTVSRNGERAEPVKLSRPWYPAGTRSGTVLVIDDEEVGEADAKATLEQRRL